MIKDKVFNAMLALEEVHARLQDKGFDFEKNGRPVVDRALKEMLIQAETFLALSV